MSDDTLFVKALRDGSDGYFKYRGQDKETVIGLLINIGCSDIEFISEDQMPVEQ